MYYRQTHTALTSFFDQQPDCIDLPCSSVGVYNYTFESESWSILPGAEGYRCNVHDRVFVGRLMNWPGLMNRTGQLDVADVDIVENRRFRYSIFSDKRKQQADGVIFLFHGLNERNWSKYLTWASRLVEQTGKAVVLLPIAFHMNRAPAEWSNPRLMIHVVEERKSKSPKLVNASFANAAISSRLQAIPQRFVWSGLQTFYDIVQFVDQIRSGQHERIVSTATVDFFGYSIGAFLGEILLMTNPEGRFSDTRLFMFCGGATVDRLYPNSRYILDSDATIALYSFFLARLENELRDDDRLAHYMSRDHPEGQFFTAMLNYQNHRELRQQRIGELCDQIAALALKRDDVIPAVEVLNTLRGEFRDIPVRVEVDDFPYEYSHVSPFPVNGPEADVDRYFDRVFDFAASHLS